MEAPILAFLVFIAVSVSALLVRIFYLIYQIYTAEGALITTYSSLPTIICIGSGGHTTEMLRIVKNLKLDKYQPRLYVVAENDVSSEVKIHKLENSSENKMYSLSRIPRSRNVNQSYISSVFSTLKATLHTFPVVYKFYPKVVFCNGPGTCIPVCVVVFLFRCFFLLDCKIVFIESICRVRTMSLTGKILQFIADVMIVQWPQLRNVCRGKYFGRLT